MSVLRWRPIRHRRPIAQHRGQALVELALIMPIFLLLIAGAIDLGRLFYAYVAITNASKEGALFGATSPMCAGPADCRDPLNVDWRVRNEAGDLRDAKGRPLAPAIVCRSSPGGAARGSLSTCVAGDTYQVGIDYEFHLITPLLGSVLDGRLILHAEATSTVLNAAVDPYPGLSVVKTVWDPTRDEYVQTPEVDPKTGLGSALEFPVGEAVKYKIVVRNTGATSLTGLTYDDQPGGWPAPDSDCPGRKTNLAPGGQYICRYDVTYKKVKTGVSNTVTVGANGISSVQDVATIDVIADPAEFLVGKDVSVYRQVKPFGSDSSLTVNRSSDLDPTVWYRVWVKNVGGRPATGLTIDDSFGPLPRTADCPKVPKTLDPGELYECFYARTFTARATYRNSATFGSNETADQTVDTTVRVDTCSAPNLVVPNLVEDDRGDTRTVGEARAQWVAAGFIGSFSPTGQDGKDVKDQNRDPFDCRSPGTSVTVSPK